MGRRAGAVRALLVAAVAATAAAPRHAGALFGDQWYVPDQSKAQLAGWIGFVSPGVGYSWFDRRLEADLFFGWVPPPLGGEHIVSLTGKLTSRPIRLALERLTVHPLTLSLQVTNTFGHEYWIEEPSRYPGDDYYPLPTALRAGIGVGSDLGLAMGRLERVSLYFELVALDAMLGFWIGNRHALSALDVFSLAIGVRLEH
jgi:hypothetical protein